MSTKQPQSGFVSIVVGLIITIILSLITVGFSRLMSREYTQASKNQFSSQAFYAAESGVNDVAYSLAAKLEINAAGDCGEDETILGDSEQEINVSIPCLNTSLVTENLQYDEIGPDQTNAQVFPLRGVGGVIPARVRITWKQFTDSPENVNYPIDQNGEFVKQSNWTADTGALKVYILPFRNGMSREAIANAAAYAYLVPVNDNVGVLSEVPYTSINGNAGFGTVHDGSCNDVVLEGCAVEFDLAGMPPDQTGVYMAISSMYRSNTVKVNIYDGSRNRIDFEGVQAVVDSTGKTAESVRRIQVRLPLTPRSTYSASGILALPNDTDRGYGVCKEITARPDLVSGCGL